MQRGILADQTSFQIVLPNKLNKDKKGLLGLQNPFYPYFI